MSEHTPAAQNPWKTEFDGRIEAFCKAIGTDEAKVREIFADLGVDGKDEQSLTIIDSEEFLPMGDLRSAFVDKGFTKITRLRLGMPHLRGKTHLDGAAATTNGGMGEVAGVIKDMVASNRPKSDWSDEELLKIYDQDAVEVIEVLGKRSHSRPCIIFAKDESVNVEASLKILKISKRQTTTDQFVIDERHVRVYRAGQFPPQLIDESPFYPRIALVDGYCSQSGTHWDRVDHKTRVLVRLHVHNVETAALSQREMASVCKDALKLENFGEEYGKALLLYKELEARDELPKLKIMPSDVRHKPFSGKVDDAFS